MLQQEAHYEGLISSLRGKKERIKRKESNLEDTLNLDSELEDEMVIDELKDKNDEILRLKTALSHERNSIHVQQENIMWQSKP